MKKVNPPTLIDQSECIPFPSSKKIQEKAPWLKQLQRLHKDEHRKFYFLCGTVAQYKEGIKKVDHWGQLMCDLEALKKDPFRFNATIEQIKKTYESVYANAEIINFEEGR